MAKGIEDQSNEIDNVYLVFDEMNNSLGHMANSIENSSHMAMKTSEKARNAERLLKMLLTK